MKEYFGGPWSLSLDEEGNIYVGDTQNHVVRMVDRATNVISTIAGRPDPRPEVRISPAESDPRKMSFPRICSMDYWNSRLYVPDWSGDLAVLAKVSPEATFAGRIGRIGSTGPIKPIWPIGPAGTLLTVRTVDQRMRI